MRNETHPQTLDVQGPGLVASDINLSHFVAKACCENGCYFFGLAGMRRSLLKAASSRKRFWS